jgi:hypothetical protein
MHSHVRSGIAALLLAASALGDHPKAAIDYHFKTGHTETA